MKAYPDFPSFHVDQAFTLCVEPGKCFSVALYRVWTSLALEPVSTPLVTVSMQGVQLLGKAASGRGIFKSEASTKVPKFDTDYEWPSVTLRLQNDEVRSDVYVAVVFEVDSSGRAVDAVGSKVEARREILPQPPDSDSMALLIARRSRPPYAKIAYVIATATYHAYNWTGGGCFYKNRYANTPESNLVTFRRPGGGLGAELGEPEDFYDKASPRQQFEHWDGKFVRWLLQNARSLQFDLYTDLDLHAGNIPLTEYQLLLSVGHHEYWSQEMRNSLDAFIGGGGNYACFSGNTCFRLVTFGPYRSTRYLCEMEKFGNGLWPNKDEWKSVGLTYANGGGWWGEWVEANKKWERLERLAYGYKVSQPSHWAFAGTGLQGGQTFGDQDRLVGYEADGVFPGSDFVALATSPQLAGWDVGGTAALGYKGDDTGPYKNGLIFNCATTDWARILGQPSAPSYPYVSKITYNILTTLSARRS
jgi:hypothetical protein